MKNFAYSRLRIPNLTSMTPKKVFKSSPSEHTSLKQTKDQLIDYQKNQYKVVGEVKAAEWQVLSDLNYLG